MERGLLRFHRLERKSMLFPLVLLPLAPDRPELFTLERKYELFFFGEDYFSTYFSLLFSIILLYLVDVRRDTAFTFDGMQGRRLAGCSIYVRRDRS